MNFRFYQWIILGFIGVLALGCRKYSDPSPINEPELSKRFYCNDIMAVNYNWGFPGTPADSLCIFPATVLEGTYTVYDSLYDAADSFQSASIYLGVSLTQIGKQSVRMSQYCSDDITLLCDAYLNILNDTAQRQNWVMCQSDSLEFRGVKQGIDTPNFTLRMNKYRDLDFYHELYFHKD